MSGEKEHKHSRILCCDCIHQDIASRAHTAGAAQERAAIVAWLKGEVARNTEATYFEPKWSPATGHCVADLARCIERGEHEKGAK